MARHDLCSAFSPVLHRLLDGIPNRRVRRALGRKASSTRPADRSRRVRPCLETLEDRITPTTFTPTTFADDGAANSLRGAITAANADKGTATDTIQLQEGTYTLTVANSSGLHETANASGDLNITSRQHALVIQGTTDAKGKPTTIIEQTVADRVFQIVNAGTTVTFQNLIIEGGLAQEDGGAGTAAGSTAADGGGILDGPQGQGGNVTLSNVVLRNNSAEGGTGENANGGGIFVGNGASLTVQSSTIADNSALGGTGNTDATNQNGGMATGGGVFSVAPTSIANSNLSNNVVTGGNASNGTGVGGLAAGGGIFAGGDSFNASNTDTITDSILDDNTLHGGSSSVNQGGKALGGGVCTQVGVTLTSCSLAGNTLTGGNGNFTNAESFDGEVGGDAEGGSVFAEQQIIITASTLSDNSLTGGQGTLDNNSATITGDIGGEAQGGGVLAQGLTIITTSLLSGNTLTGGNGNLVSGIADGNKGGSAFGGGLNFEGGTGNAVTVTASTLSGNTLTGGNGSENRDAALAGFAQGGGARFSGEASVTLVNATIANNQVIGGLGTPVLPVASGGGLLFTITNNAPPTATLTNVTVAGNKASLPPGGAGGTSGGGIANVGGILSLANTLVAQNNATNGPDVAGFVSNSDHNLIGNTDGSDGFSASHGDLLGTTANPLNPLLGPLQNNGGPTPTMALALVSPAVNAGDDSAQADTGPFDQRGQGFARVARGAIDIGAYEVPQPLIHFPPPGLPVLPPTLRVPFLLALFDSLLHGVETGNGRGVWTVTDSFLGIPLLVCNYDSAGNLMNVNLFEFNVTTLFELS